MLPANTPQLMRVRAVGEFKHLFDTRGKALRQRKLFDFTSVLFLRHAASLTGAGPRRKLPRHFSAPAPIAFSKASQNASSISCVLRNDSSSRDGYCRSHARDRAAVL
jgi:hypothetical protein